MENTLTERIQMCYRICDAMNKVGMAKGTTLPLRELLRTEFVKFMVYLYEGNRSQKSQILLKYETKYPSQDRFPGSFLYTSSTRSSEKLCVCASCNASSKRRTNPHHYAVLFRYFAPALRQVTLAISRRDILSGTVMISENPKIGN